MKTPDEFMAWVNHEFEAEYERTFDELAGIPPAGVSLFGGGDVIEHLDFAPSEVDTDRETS